MNDVFGKALYSYWKGDHNTTYIIRRDDGYIDSSSLEGYFTPKLFETEQQVEDFAHGRILDVGCGAGRHLLYFENRNFDITGIDISPLAIQVSRERGCAKAVRMDIFKTSFQAASFDTILLFGHNIGMGGDLNGVVHLLKDIRTLIREDGVLLLTSTDTRKTADPQVIAYQQKSIENGHYIGTFRIRIEYKDLVGEWFEWIYLDPETLARLPQKTGWRIEMIHHEKEGRFGAALKPL